MAKGFMQELSFKEYLMISFDDCIQLELNEFEIKELIKQKLIFIELFLLRGLIKTLSFRN